MNVNQLRYLIAVADELSFTRAAVKCNVSQPPLSRAINLLEAEVGAKLFERDSHKVVVTEPGASLVGDARRALALIEAGLQRARQVADGKRGTITIGFGGSPVYWLWPELVKRFRSAVPDVELCFVSMPVLDQIEALRENRIDLGIVRLPIHDELLQTRLVYREGLVVALPSDWAGFSKSQNNTVRIEQLAAEQFVTYEPRRGFEYHADLRALCRLAAFEPMIRHEGPTTESVVGMVACGEGVAVLPASAARLQMDNVTFLALDGKGVPQRLGTVEFALAWHREHQSAAAAEFVEHAGHVELQW